MGQQNDAAQVEILDRNKLTDIIADAYGDKNRGHLSLKAADAILAHVSQSTDALVAALKAERARVDMLLAIQRKPARAGRG